MRNAESIINGLLCDSCSISFDIFRRSAGDQQLLTGLSREHPGYDDVSWQLTVAAACPFVASSTMDNAPRSTDNGHARAGASGAGGLAGYEALADTAGAA